MVFWRTAEQNSTPKNKKIFPITLNQFSYFAGIKEKTEIVNTFSKRKIQDKTLKERK